jgi:AcrR family transcriptional regulator
LPEAAQASRAAAGRPAAPLGRRDWLEAGQRLLLTSGVGGLKLRALASSLGISTGSFYHHFNDFDAYLVALAKYYSGEQLAASIATVLREAHTPYDRIVRASLHARDLKLPELMVAMRAWARRDARVAPEVAVLERGLMDFLAECFAGLGFTQEQAAARAFVMVSVATAEVAQPDLGDRSRFGGMIIDLVCEGAPALRGDAPQN